MCKKSLKNLLSETDSLNEEDRFGIIAFDHAINSCLENTEYDLIALLCRNLHLHIGEQRDPAYVAKNKSKIIYTFLVARNSAKRIFPTN